MMIPIYVYNENGKVFVSTTLPSNLAGFPTFDLFVKLPCPYVFIDEMMMAVQNSAVQDFVYRLFVDVSEETIATFAIENGKILANIWLYFCPVNGLNFYFTPTIDLENSTVVTIDPPQPIDVRKLKEFSDIYSNSLKKMNINKPFVIKIIIRIPI